MNRVDDIEAAFIRLKTSAERYMGGDEGSKERSFQDIFSLNNEIGRTARQQPETMARMKELQAYVNMITVGLKYGKEDSLREGLSSTEASIRALKKESSARP